MSKKKKLVYIDAQFYKIWFSFINWENLNNKDPTSMLEQQKTYFF